ncbi:hypothetical protein SynWH8103_00518 [Synechococcus sp. WH 8103]|nr:hypothetical protein SynWH8103_00518 [Synechococcus sp. WH 8103]
MSSTLPKKELDQPTLGMENPNLKQHLPSHHLQQRSLILATMNRAKLVSIIRTTAP